MADVKPLGMDNDPLREKLALTLYSLDVRGGLARFNLDHYSAHADAALAALGLDDMDAAAVRGARVIDPEAWTGVGYGFEAAAQSRDSSLAMARAVLEAALTATEEGQS
jgi:hypothetical protein